KVVGGELIVEINKSMTSDKEISINIEMPSLQGLTLRGGVQAYVSGVDAKSFKLNASDGISADISGKFENLDAVLNGGCSIKLKGSAAVATINGGGGTSLNAKHFTIDTAKVEADGGATLDLGAVKNLDAVANGGASINYTGDPQIIRGNADISGSIHKY
ncbi:MAG TPA: DUF2807 domain-containing protein, partial [Roseimicrobium sp.]|nr:DUF2807 domain-containing protein [Roseimicrobium sp.]